MYHHNDVVQGFSDEEMQMADRVARRFLSGNKGFVEYEDLYQECLTWFVEHPRKAAEYAEDERKGGAMLWQALSNTCRDYVRQERAAKSGYSPDDQYFYSIGMVQNMLPLIFNNDFTSQAVVNVVDRSAEPEKDLDQRKLGGSSLQESVGAPAVMPRRPRGYRTTSDIPEMVADVKVGYESLTEQDKALLENIYGSGDPRKNMTDEAAILGITREALAARVRRACGRLRKPLGGSPPRREESE